MARLAVTELLRLGLTDDELNASWQVSTTSDFSDLLVDIEDDPSNIFSISVAVRNHDGTIYASNQPLYARVRFFAGDRYTAWFELPMCLQEPLNDLSLEERHELLEELNQNTL